MVIVYSRIVELFDETHSPDVAVRCHGPHAGFENDSVGDSAVYLIDYILLRRHWLALQNRCNKSDSNPCSSTNMPRTHEHTHAHAPKSHTRTRSTADRTEPKGHNSSIDILSNTLVGITQLNALLDTMHRNRTRTNKHARTKGACGWCVQTF